MNIVVKKTHELTADEKCQIVELFNKVFLKSESAEIFFRKYFWTTTNGSYHSMMKDNDAVVGCYSVIPYDYKFFDKNVHFGLSVDTMINENFRGNPFDFKKMASAVYEKLVADGISFVFGFPNENVYLVRKKILKWQDIGTLDFYILPIKLGKIKPGFQFLNWVSIVFSALIIMYTRVASTKPSKYFNADVKMLAVKSDYFISQRYGIGYEVIRDDVGYVAYRTFFEKNSLYAYILDVYPLNQERLEHAVNLVYENEPDISAIIYIGNLDFVPKNMIKVPKRFAPKLIRLSGLILNRSVVDDRIFDMANWQVSIANFDVR